MSHHEQTFNKKAILRVELKNYNPHAGREEREGNFKRLFTMYKKERSASGINKSLKEKEAFESKGRKKRRKRRENEIARLKEKLRENFFDFK